jgi:uncharacterized protein YjbI with pentapeptide repeats
MHQWQFLVVEVSCILTALSISIQALCTDLLASISVGLGTPHNYEDLSNKDLRKNAYTKAELRQTNFSGSDLSGVSLFGALAKGANFQGATLRATDLESCDLEDADFTNAVLEGAQVASVTSLRVATGVSCCCCNQLSSCCHR